MSDLVNTDFLYVVAEVGAAFAGFSTVVAVIAGNTRRDVNTSRTISMLSLSLMVVLFALMPTLTRSFGLSDGDGWRLASLMYALAWSGYWAGIMRALTAGSFGANIRELSWINRVNSYFTHPVSIVVLFASAFGFSGDAVAAVYGAALMVMVSLSALLFLQMVISVFRAEDPDAPSSDR